MRHPRPLVLACAAGLAIGIAAADSAAELATAFGRGFLEGRHEENTKVMSPEMQAAFAPAQAAALLDRLTGDYGAVTRIGEAWLQDTVQHYRRFRLPVDFERQALDLRIVVDDSDRVAGLFLVPRIEPPQETEPARAPVPEVAVEVAGLPGTLTLPSASDEGLAGVVLVHGSGPADRDETIGPNRPFRDLAWGLAERGVAVLRYDKRSFARPDDLAAVGDALTVEHEVIDDARQALALLRDRPETDPARVYLLGHSLGGMLAPRIATGEPRPAGVVVLAGSARPLPETVLEQVRYIVSLDGELSEAEAARLESIEADVATLRRALEGEAPAHAGTVLGAPVAYYADLEAHDPPSEAAALGLPLLVLQGGRDYQVTERDFERWQRGLAGNDKACLHAYADLDHLFRRGEGIPGPHDYERAAPVAPEVIDDIAAWIQRRRCPAAR
jgi:dienelactone hydrolase